MVETKNIYQENGYKNRRDYLECMAEDYNIPLDVVFSIASLYGKSEYFDGLINALEDYEMIMGE